MSRINSTFFNISIVNGQLTLNINHPSLPTDRLVYDDAALTALLTAPQKTALTNLLTIFYARAEADAKALIQSRRTALDTDP